MNESRRRDFLKIAGGVAVVGGLAGCAGEAQEDGEDGSEGDQPEEGQEEPGAGQEEEPPEEEPQEEPEEDEEPQATGDDLIRLAHMAPDFPAVDVYIDDGTEPAVGGLSYTDTTEYIPLGAGDHQIRVTAAESQALVVFDEQVSVPAGNTTAVALGQPADGQQEGGSNIGFQLELFGDDNSPPADSINNSRLRLIHASPDAPAVNVLVGETAVFENIGFGEAEYFNLPAGDYDFDIVPADGGTTGEGGGGAESDGDGGLFSSLAADGGSEVSLLQEDENESEDGEELPEEGEEQEDTGVTPVASFDASVEPNGVYTAFATGYLDPEAADSEAEFDVVVTQDVTDGEVPQAEVEEDDEDEEEDE